MKNQFLSITVMLLFLSSCSNEGKKQDTSSVSNKEQDGIDKVNAPVQKSMKSQANWSGEAQEWVHEYRNDTNYQLMAPNNGELQKIHGIAMDIADVTNILDPDEDGVLDSTIRKLYLMPALKTVEVNGNPEKVFTIVMAPLKGEPNQNDVDPSMEVVITDNEVYDHYSPCPPLCPTISWFGSDIPDNQAK